MFRYRMAARSSAANVLSRGLAMVTMVASVALTVPYLGIERFGLWMTLSSLATVFALFDFGIGNALVNRVAAASAGDRPEELQAVVGDGLAVMGVLAAILGVVLVTLAVAAPVADWLDIRAPDQAAELRASAVLFAALFSVSLFSSSILRVFAGLQRAYEAHLFVAAGSAVSLAALTFAARQEAGVPQLVAATFGISALAPLPLLALLARRGLLVRTRRIARERVKPLLQSGALFFVLQIGLLVGWGLDPLILAGTAGLAEVALYVVALRLFQFVTQPLAILNAPLWAAYAEASARGDRTFVAGTLRRSMALTLALAAVGTALLAAAGPALVALWTSATVVPSATLLWCFAAWSLVEAVGTAFAMFLNGAGVIRTQVVAVVLFCLVALPAKILAGMAFGATGVVCATLGCYLAVFPAAYAIFGRTEISRALGLSAR